MWLIKFLSLLLPLVQARTVVHDWNITYVTTNRGLDQPARRGIGVNNQLPLPVVEAEIGDTLVLNVFNSLDVPTSLHAHGIFQRGTNYYDGVAMVNSCPIAPGSRFTYEIPLEQSGTYWIHGHTDEQNFDGLRTPLVVHDRNDPYPADQEYLFAVDDWWPINIHESLELLRKPGGLGTPFIYPPQTLINGYFGNLTSPMEFEPGRTYRIRLVSMMSLPLWEFAIDDHELQIIEVDGVLTKPKRVDVVRLAPAQRVSVLVTAKESRSMNYQYHITVLDDYVLPIPGVYPAQFDGAVVYHPDAPVDIVDYIPSEPFDDLGLESLEYEPALFPDRSLFLNLTYGFTKEEVPAETINLVTYRDSLVPTIFSALTTSERAINPITYGPQTNAHIVKYGEVVEMLLWSPTLVPHPMHLHGYVFQVIERGFTNDTTGAYRRRAPSTDFSPLKRDSIHVPQEEYAIVRFRADNPGVWNFHCHIDWHMGMGLNMVFVVGPREMQETLRVPQSVYEQCEVQGIGTSGNAAGHYDTYNYDSAPQLPYLEAGLPAAAAALEKIASTVENTFGLDLSKLLP
ncbi:ferroxidase fet3 [Coemansia sp. RSA 552]|nr:ferroxidase fet3 [Coemansia sp. RSA 552]